MVPIEFLERLAALRREGQTFALATVVARRAPVSAHLGDRAIVFPDGRMEGFIGGACSREIVRQQALEVLQARCGRLVSIRPDAGDSIESSAEHVMIPMSCASEGAIDVYVEPFVEARRLVVVGATPVAEALARLARSMDYDVCRVVDAREQRDVAQAAEAIGVTVADLDQLETILRERRAHQAVVVASQGHYDEQALASVLNGSVSYVGLVASRKRGATVRAMLEANGVRGAEHVRIPAGLDLGARTPAEVALSILAEIVQACPSGAPAQATAPVAAASTMSSRPAMSMPGSAVDPVCGMRVDVATARHTAELDGIIYYFCCANCRARFLHHPQPSGAHT